MIDKQRIIGLLMSEKRGLTLASPPYSVTVSNRIHNLEHEMQAVRNAREDDVIVLHYGEPPMGDYISTALKSCMILLHRGTVNPYEGVSVKIIEGEVLQFGNGLPLCISTDYPRLVARLVRRDTPMIFFDPGEGALHYSLTREGAQDLI